MASFVDVCKFTVASSGTGSFVFSAIVTGYQSPANAQMVDAQVYKYRAESSPTPSEWEIGYGTYTVSTTTLTRTTVLANSAGTTTALNFSAAPQVGIVGLAEDLLPVDGSIFGLGLSTAGSSATFSVAAGWCADSTAVNIMRLYSAISKTTSAWAVGSTNGGLDTGAIANSTWYHAFVIKRLDTGVTDVLFSLSPTAPTMPANYTLKRRFGSIKTTGSALWVKFVQDGDWFAWDVWSQDVAATNPGTAAVTRTMNTPLGVRVNGMFTVSWFNSTGIVADNPAQILISDLSISDQTPSVAGAVANIGVYSSVIGLQQISANPSFVMTNTSSQIRSRSILSSANTTVYISTVGWIDRRGRDA